MTDKQTEDAGSSETTQETCKVVVWGDSIAAGGWPEMAERSHNVAGNTGMACQVINEGSGGLPACVAKTQFEERILSHNPDLVIIQFGFNDIRFDGSRGEKPLSTLEEFHDHLTEMATNCRDKANADVLMVGNHRVHRPFILPNGETYDQARQNYTAVTRTVAQELHLPFTDMAAEIDHADADYRDIVNEDGVHLTLRGNQFYGAIIGAAIGTIIRAE